MIQMFNMLDQTEDGRSPTNLLTEWLQQSVKNYINMDD